MEYEEVLARVGKMGRYQVYLCVLSIVACSNAGIHLFNIVFTMGMPRFRCAVPGLLNDTFTIQNEAHGRLVNATIPFDLAKGSYSKCNHYKTSLNLRTWETLNHTSLETQSCSRWLDLVCDRQIFISHANMIGMVGIMVMTMVTGALSDRWGRKRLFILMNWIQLIASIATVFVKSEISFLILRFVEVGSGMASFMCLYGLVTEISAPSRRVVGTSVNIGGWNIGMLAVILVAFFVREWKTLQLILTAPLVLTALTFPLLIPESPKWLLSKKRYSEAHAILQTIAKVNGKSLPEEVDLAGGKEESSHKSAGIVRGLILLFKSPILALRLVILAISWTVNTMVYYGVGLNMGFVIPGDIYLNFFLITVIFLIFIPLMVWILLRGQRKKLLCVCMMLGGVSCIATILPILGSSSVSWVTTLLSCLGKLFLNVSFAVIWLYTTELLPTVARLSGVGFCNFFGRTGAMVAPYIATLPIVVDGKIGQALPLLVFGACGLVSGTLCLLLPETGNGRLPDTVREAELLKRRKKEISNVLVAPKM
ncbi:hypothetical protein RRG08_012736 [Elysia crispata]|uniref:Major facilitator superfamily (MFS) profile domain-containing protein n=1 Tax=Elysia crispata TaxID=231223 RepID=A0AAE1DJN5_9GAST|nr:hypothetical protein RRG08_012736 [Elysia crispata]